jgi:hypothetical protein
MAIKTAEKWTMPLWMEKYSQIIGGKNYGTKVEIERIYNSASPVYLLVKARIAAKIEVIQHMESKRMI